MHDPIEFRVATDDDRSWAAAIMASSEPWTTLGRGFEACRRVVDSDRSDVTVAFTGATRLGFAIVDPHGLAGGPYVRAIAVDAMSRSAGIGSAILDLVEERYGRPAGNLFLCVSSFNERAKALYERRGFVQIGEIEDYLIEGASERIMRKRFERA
jgi:ribosomal protein S18 acetylase RimI-like enzyme